MSDLIFDDLISAPNFSGGSDDKESAYNAGYLGSIPESGRSPGEGMATHSSILAWRTPWTEKLVGLQSMWSLRVRQSKTNTIRYHLDVGLPWCLRHSEESACSGGDPGSTPGLGRVPGEGNGYPFQYSCLENPMDRGAWWVPVCGVAESDTTEAT